MGVTSDIPTSKCNLLTKRLEKSRNQKKIRTTGSSRSSNNGIGAAIATQVINPRAIGGSMRSSISSYGFSASGEDQETFLGGKNKFRRVLKNKLCFYGMSTAALLLIMTGIVLAVGFMQSEKQKLQTKKITKTYRAPRLNSENSDIIKDKMAEFSYFRDHDVSSETKVKPAQGNIRELKLQTDTFTVSSMSNNNESSNNMVLLSNSAEEYENPTGTITDTTSSTYSLILPEIIDTGLFAFENGSEIVDETANDIVTTSKSFETDIFEEQDQQTSPTNPTTAQLSAPPPQVREPDRHYTPRPNSVVVEYGERILSDERPSHFRGNRLRLRRPWHSNRPVKSDDRPNGFFRVRPKNKTNSSDGTPTPKNPTSIQNILESGEINTIFSRDKYPTPTTTQITPVTFNFNTSTFDFSSIKDLITSTTTASPVPAAAAVNVSKNLYNFIPYDQINDSSLLLASSSSTTTTSSPVVPQQFNSQVISKRTYPSIDFSSSNINFQNTPSNSNSNANNPFAHLLTQNTPISSIGFPTPTGASLSTYFSPLNYGGYNFDSVVSDSVSSTIANLPSGSIPLDLASSFTAVPTYYPGSGGENVEKPKSFSSLYPPPSYSSSSASASNYFDGSNQNPFQKKNSVGSLTTKDGTIPSYNTITQGIHLLSLLGGNIPEHYAGNSFDLNFGASENSYAQTAKPELQIAALAGYGGSGDQFVQKLETSDHPSPLLSAESRQTSSYVAPPIGLAENIVTQSVNPELIRWLNNLMTGAENVVSKTKTTKLSETNAPSAPNSAELTPLVKDFGRKLVLKTARSTRVEDLQSNNSNNNGPKSGFYV